MKKPFVKVLLILVLIISAVQLPTVADKYFRQVVKEIIEQQIDQRRDEIDQQMKDNINDALQDENTQKQVQSILRAAVAAELQENGESYLRDVIEKRAPHAMPLLFPNPPARKNL